ncbi:hypothetical protein DES53_11387 [Roseimicrobium gellanilyticum]|uniref:Uncharacterized protein n=1 Tax=Roseimicrobium gellanilyticum TaxID=748857 RepID=A0A366H9E2_9BACT|nr:hypothetical protein [Roseimicrobium gellanilyticum]RBP37705.1 hypothetical protein DES53_11387 [Roseimicrobium gellanilyticum]
MALPNTIPARLVAALSEENRWRFGLACFVRQCPTLLYFDSLGVEIPTHEVSSMRSSSVELLSTPGQKPDWLPEWARTLVRQLEESMPDLSEGDHPAYAFTALYSQAAAVDALKLSFEMNRDSISNLWSATEQVVASYLYQVLQVSEDEEEHPWLAREADWMLEVAEAINTPKAVAPLLVRANGLHLHAQPF